MTNQQLIADRQHLDDKSIVVELNAATIQKTDSARWTWAGLAIRFGSDVVGAFDELLKASPGYDWVRLLLAGGGIDFSSDTTQNALEGLRPKLGDATDALKAVGVYQQTPWNNAGNAGQVTESEVAEIRAELMAESARAAVAAKWATVQNEIVNPMVSVGASWDDIKVEIAKVD